MTTASEANLESYAENDSDGRIALGLILRPLLRSKYMILGGVLLGLLIGVSAALLGGSSYVVSMTVIPAESNAGQTGSVGSLSSLLSATTDAPLSKYKQFQTAFNSNGMAALLEVRYPGLCDLMPSRCDPVTHTWKVHLGGHPFVRQYLDPFLGEARDTLKPDATQVAAFIQSRVKLDVDKSSVTTISMTCDDYVRCEEFLTQLVATANEYVKNNDRGPLKAYVDYLTQELSTLTNVNQRSVLDQLLLDEERRLMMTQVKVEYAAMTLDQPHSKLDPPLRLLIIWPFLGLAVSVGLSYLFTYGVPALGRRRPGARSRRVGARESFG